MAESSGLEKLFCSKVEAASNWAKNEGWAITREAAKATEQKRRDELTKWAANAYHNGVYQVAKIVLFAENYTTQQSNDLIALELVRANINVGDLYRRLGRLDEAEELLQSSLERATKLGHNPTTFRAGNFLSLLQSAKAYHEIEREDYAKALQGFRSIASTFDNMHLDQTSGLEAVMLYTNQAANYLNLARASTKLGLSPENFEPELVAAEQAVETAEKFLDGLGPSDKARWIGNLLFDRGEIAFYRGDTETATNYYHQLLEVGQESNDLDLIVCAQVKLAHSYYLRNNPEKAKEFLESVEEFLKTKTFGIYRWLNEPLINEVREFLKQK